jgi:hypothetical protein
MNSRQPAIAIAIVMVAFFALVIFVESAHSPKNIDGTWISTADPSTSIDVSSKHIVHHTSNNQTVMPITGNGFNTIFIENERSTIEVNGDTLVIGGGKLSGAYRRVNSDTPVAVASSVLLGQKLTTFTQKIQSLRDKYKILEKDRLDITAALAQLGVRSSSDLTTAKSRQLATELAEVVIQQQELQTQFADVQRILDEGQSLQRRLSREELVNDGKIPNEELRKQSDELIEILTKLDQKFQNTGTVNTQQAIDKIVDEQLRKN